VRAVPGTRWMRGGAPAALVVALVAAGCGSSKDNSGAAPEAVPAVVAPIKGTDLSRVTLSADAVRRLGIRTAPALAATGRRTVIPYAAVLYDAGGGTFTYTSPQPRVFVRHAIRVIRIDGDRALLAAGPPAGTPVVTVGAQELYGSEYDVEED
jgi:hypothetical protein